VAQFTYGNLPMKIRELARKQMSSVPCPMCGAPAGQRCRLQAGGLRNEAHTSLISLPLEQILLWAVRALDQALPVRVNLAIV
jgi:hypothetical protein